MEAGSFGIETIGVLQKVARRCFLHSESGSAPSTATLPHQRRCRKVCQDSAAATGLSEASSAALGVVAVVAGS